MRRSRFLYVLLLVSLAACGPAERTWTAASGYRWAELDVPSGNQVGFERVLGPELGLDFRNDLSEEGFLKQRHLANGAGVALGDVDGDGRAEVYLCRLEGPNQLFRNLGNRRFEDITEQAGVALPDRRSTGAVFADVDGDGDLDLLVGTLGDANALFINDGAGHFTNQAEAAGITEAGRGTKTLALADIDADGDLDLYVANYKEFTVKDVFPPEARTRDQTIEEIRPGEFAIRSEYQDFFRIRTRREGETTFIQRFEVAEADGFFRNDGTGRFTPISFTDGTFRDENGQPLTEAPREWSLTVRFQDIDQDGDPDLYLCNDFESPDHIWLNDGTGEFHALPTEAIRSTSGSTMGIDFSDIDRDGDLDFFTVDMLSRQYERRLTQWPATPPQRLPFGDLTHRPQYPRNMLFLNRGDTTFADIAFYAGVAASEWSWATVFMDVDLDGFEDLLITTGHLYDPLDGDVQQRLAAAPPGTDWRRNLLNFPPLDLPNIAFRNRGDRTFEDIGQAWGFGPDADVSHGMASADLDDDGDLDLVVNRLNNTAVVYWNQATAARVSVRVRGAGGNTQAIGAALHLMGDNHTQIKTLTSGGNYLSGSDPQVTFAVDTNMRLDITWPDGQRSVIEEIQPNRVYEIDEATIAKHPPASPAPQPTPHFADASEQLNHAHTETEFDDFVRQPLLPNKLSQLGPAIAWFDTDGDGDDDALIGGGAGGHMAHLRNDDGRFRLVQEIPLANDQHAVLAWQDRRGRHVWAGVSSYESAAPETVARFTLQDGRLRATRGLTIENLVPGPMTMGDFDQDGDLDLFVGGRVVAGQYPQPATSVLFRNDDGTFVQDEAHAALFVQVGLVSGATFSDIDGDGDVDLLLALEWGPIRLFENDNGQFRDATLRYGLDAWSGWWNGLATADFDGDGRLDIIATNWGQNTAYRVYENRPLRTFYDDLDGNGTFDVIEALFHPGRNTWVPRRDRIDYGLAIPYTRRTMSSQRQFARSNLLQILGPPLRQAGWAEINTLAHMVFLNRGETFEAQPLPAEAQWAPAFAPSVADFDGDGHEDVVLSQNFFAVQIETSRSDAGRGLWLRGAGTGQFTAVSGVASGIKAYGEQRGAAATDFDGDGRVDVLITQNVGPTKLYHNQQALPGLRVRLLGSADNPQAIGAVVQIQYGATWRAARAISLGSGYWSQAGAVQVFARHQPPTAIRVRWPDGSQTESPLPENATEITVAPTGTVTQVR